jgi:hypothetical protein
VACAQCHDHKYDPIPTTDYHSLLDVFNKSEAHEYPLASEDVVNAYKQAEKKFEKKEKELKDFIDAQSSQLAGILASKTPRFLLAAQELEPAEGLDQKTLDRWQRYLKRTEFGKPSHARANPMPWRRMAPMRTLPACHQPVGMGQAASLH